jgi:SAM-dependent methyltransferase
MDEKIEKRFKNISKSKTFGNIIKIFDLDNKSVLDIGCSYGEFLSHFGDKSVGITIIEEEVKYAKHKGLDVRLGNVEPDDFILQEKFDVIFANNIFEHLYSPHGFLVKIKKYLKSDGFIILGVPCVPKIVSLIRFNKFKGSLAGAHINFFTKYTLTKTVEKAGYRVKTTRGFRFKNKFMDHLLDLIYPHFYVVAFPDENFKYSEKRMRELRGYSDMFSV